MTNNNKIDAYIEEAFVNGEKRFNLFLHYNGLDYVFLSKDEKAEEFAINFKWKYLVTNPAGYNHVFTDNKGWVKEKRDYKSFIASIKGIEEIDDAITNLVITSINLDIQSDFTIHLNDKEYEIVKDVDNVEYFAGDTLRISKKGISKDALQAIDRDLKELKKLNRKVQY